MVNILNKIKWIIKKNKFKKIGNHFYIGKNSVISDAKRIEIGNYFSAANNFKILTWEKYDSVPTGYNPKVTIGNNVTFNDNCFISCLDEINIGDGCLFGDNVFITDNYHGNLDKKELDVIPIKRKLYSKGKVIIGKNVWCGRNVAILSDVTIGNNVIIGANAVVTHSFEDNVVIAGVPAKIIKKIGE